MSSWYATGYTLGDADSVAYLEHNGFLMYRLSMIVHLKSDLTLLRDEVTAFKDSSH